MIDFTPVRQGLTLSEFAPQFTVDDLKAATNALIDTILDLIHDATDAQIAFVPHDPDANDPYATPEEEHIGWSLGHLVAHTTATTEEGAAHSSVLARGIPYPRDPRLRYETPWRVITTHAQAVQRLEESRRIVLGYLNTWPDEPHLDVLRDVSERFIERYGPQNATVAVLSGLLHQDGHLDQFRWVLRAAQDASEAVHGD